MNKDIIALKASARQLLEENILHFWLTKMQDYENGGFYGRIDGHDVLHKDADKGCVLNARILWSFASAYRVLSLSPTPFSKAKGVCSPDALLTAAIRAKDYILEHFIDKKRGGVYWSVDYKGQPKDTKKQSYAIGFTIYGMSELYRATGDEEALQCAIDLFCSLEEHAFDAKDMGYIEALTYDWRPIQDMRLSERDENGSRTMNTHLHILEPYTNLYRSLTHSYSSPLPRSFAHPVPKKEWGMGGVDGSLDDVRNRVDQKLRVLIDIFTKKLLNPSTHHLDLFFDNQWQGRRNIESYGHDIEAAWLLTEALEVLGDEQLMAATMPVIGQIAKASEEGLQADGSMIHECHKSMGDGLPSSVDADRHWWVQCECVIGELNQYQHFGDEEALKKALHCYDYIERHFIDHEQGEWYWSRRPDGSINRDEDKAGFWKCPYHNSRMCLEILEREF